MQEIRVGMDDENLMNAYLCLAHAINTLQP